MAYIITERKFYNQLKNGTTFGSSTSDYDTFFRYNAAEYCKAVYTLRFSWESESSSTNKFDIVGGIVTRETGSFIEDGFSAGDTIDIFNSSPTTADYSDVGITALTDTQIVLDDGSINESESGQMILRGKTPLTGFNFKYNIIENADVFSVDNLQDGAMMAWTVEDVGTGGVGSRSTAFVDGVYAGSPLTGKTGSFKMKFVQDIDTYTQEFQFEHVFRNFPFYLDSESGVFDTLNITPLRQDGSFKYTFNLRAGTTTSQNPNERKEIIEEEHLGNSGGFDENFNGNTAGFGLESISYSDNGTGASTSQIDIINDTDVEILINSPTGIDLDDDHPVVVYFCKLPSDVDIVNTEDFDTNWVFDSVRTTRGAGASSSGSIRDVLVTAGSPASDQLVINFTTQFNASDSAKFTEGDNYLIAVAVAELGNENSTRVTVKADFNQVLKSTDVSGLFETQDFGYYRHDMEEGVDTPFTSYSGWIEDAALLEYRFNLDTALTPILEKFRVKLVAFDTTDDSSFVIQQQEFDFSNAPLSGATQQIVLSSENNLNLPSGNQFKDLSFALDGTSGTKQIYKMLYPFRINYEDYLALNGVDGVFFDAADGPDLFYGLNRKISNYDGVSSYEIRHIIEADVLDANGVSTTYIERLPYMEVQNYEDDDGLNVFSSYSMQAMTLGGTQLPDNQISKNQDTLIRATFTFTSTVSSSLAYNGIIRLEEYRNGGIASIEEASTVYDIPSGQKLQPKSGETKTTIVNDGNTLVLECIIPESVSSHLPDGTRLHLSARVFGPLSGIVGAKLTEAGVVKTTEGGFTKVVE